MSRYGEKAVTLMLARLAEVMSRGPGCDPYTALQAFGVDLNDPKVQKLLVREGIDPDELKERG